MLTTNRELTVLVAKQCKIRWITVKLNLDLMLMDSCSNVTVHPHLVNGLIVLDLLSYSNKNDVDSIQ